MVRARFSILLVVAFLASCAGIEAPKLQPLSAGAPSYWQWLHRAEQLSAPGTTRRPVQLIVAIRAQMGEHEAAIAEADAELPLRPAGKGPDLNGDQAEDAIAAIVREAASRQIVIINESHNLPVNRAFSMRLARELRKIGFAYLAAETFSASADLNAGAVTQATGTYTADPVFAEFVRDARRDGWRLTSYEAQGAPDEKLSPAERIRWREQAQARNIIDGILAAHPDARILIHTGPGHAIKSPQAARGESVLWMAGELKRMTGIDPLCIDQGWTYAHPDPRREVAGYRAAVERAGAVDGPFVLRRPEGGYRVLQWSAGSFDMQVFHPPAPPVKGRAGWLVTLAQRQPFDIPPSWRPAQGRRLIHAVHLEDPAQAIPADLIIIEAGKAAPSMMLPPGRYRFEFEDEAPAQST